MSSYSPSDVRFVLSFCKVVSLWVIKRLLWYKIPKVMFGSVTILKFLFFFGCVHARTFDNISK